MFGKIFIFVLLFLALNAQKDYTDLVRLLKSNIENKTGIFYHSAYQRLAYITDTYGPRVWGSQTLEMVISQIATMAKKEGFDNVRLEPVKNFTKWVRGHEELTLYSPRPTLQKLSLIGLGRAVPGNIKAEAIVIRNFIQLESRKNEVKGKIVVYNQQWTTYGESSDYRYYGAGNASLYGALAVLVRSATPFSIYSVHTGNQKGGFIPAACITVQDAEMMQRMQNRGQKIILHLVLESQQVENANSNNVVFQIKGSEKPDEILLMGGHIDSWDTGSQTGANDDGGGFINCFEAMRLILKSGLRPKRTIRFIAWSGQEFNEAKSGSHAYAQAHKNQLDKHIAAFQSDEGSTKLLGFGYEGNQKGKQIVQMILNKYLSILGASTFEDDGDSIDTRPLAQSGVPTMRNVIKDNQTRDYYFQFHHSAGDSMTVMNPDEMDSNVVGIASMFFILADLDQTIPRVSNLHLSSN